MLLTGANPYTGTTSVAAGTLLVNGAQTGSAVSVGFGATLGGTGSVGSVSGAGIVSPGSEPGASATGILTATSANLTNGALLAQIAGYATPGVSYDRLAVTGGLTLNERKRCQIL